MRENRIIYFIFLLTIFLLFLKSDFRIINELKCCQDDYDYYSHAMTIVQDFDFDYTNQFESKERFYKNNKIAPIGFFGSGLLAAPFLGIGNLLDTFFNTDQNILTFKKLIYSFSSIFYLFISINLLNYSFNFLKYRYLLAISVFGSGIIYYSFERFSMTHTYEVFTISLIFYFLEKYYISEKKNLYAILIPLAFLLSFLVRWTNYYIVFLPYIFKTLLSKNSGISLFKNYYFYISSIISVFLFALHTKLIYGKVVFYPTYIYKQNIGTETINVIKSDFMGLLINFINDSVIILFTQEFGIFWFSPLIFIGFLFSIFKLLKSERSKKNAYFLAVICYLQCFMIISLWNTTASSYGFRYLFSLIPLSVFLLKVLLDEYQNKFVKNYLFIFSIFGILSVLFFESNLGTQLSLVPIENSFGIEVVYSQPKYLTGIFGAFVEIESYLKIFATSFLGAIFFKIVLSILSKDRFLEILRIFGNTSENEDLNILLNKIEIITVDKFLISIIFSLLIVKYFLYFIKKN